MAKYNVLIACEESQAECKAFREAGFNAFSCDIQPVRRGGNAAWHIHNDVTPLLMGATHFYTQDGKRHTVSHWHLIIAHPPCTYLCRSSALQMKKQGKIDWQRYRNMLLARRFFFACLNAAADHVAVENPIPMARTRLPAPSCYIEPFWFGVKYSKKTLYWLKNLPPVLPQLIHPAPRCYFNASKGIYRSRTFPQVAAALANQWGEYIRNYQRIRKNT